MWAASDEIGVSLLILGIAAGLGVLGLIGYFVWILPQAARSKGADRDAGDAMLRQVADMLGGEFRRPPPVRRHQASKEFGAVGGEWSGLTYHLSLHRWSDAEVGGSAHLVVHPAMGDQFVLEVFGWKGPRRLPPDVTLADILGPDVAASIPPVYGEPLRDLIVDSRAVGASRGELHVYSPTAVFEWPVRSEPVELANWTARVLERAYRLLLPAEEPTLDPLADGNQVPLA
jgi:hypothetical protein